MCNKRDHRIFDLGFPFPSMLELWTNASLVDTKFPRTHFSILCAGNPTSTRPWKVRISTASRGIKYRGTWGDRHYIHFNGFAFIA